MSYRTTTLFLFKESNDSVSKINFLLDKYNKALKELGLEDDVWACLNNETIRGYRVIECGGMNVTFGNLKAALDGLDLEDLHYVDYIDSNFNGSSDLGSIVFTLNNSIPIAWDSDMSEVDYQLQEYFKDKGEMSIASFIDESESMEDTIDYINDVSENHLRWINCSPNGVDDSNDIEF